MKRYTRSQTGYLMVLLQSEDLFRALEDLMTSENIPGATFYGLGIVNVKFGVFDTERKVYLPKEFQFAELASLTGSLAWQDGKPSVHAHGVVTDKSFQTFGGHILEAKVARGSAEITVLTLSEKLQRVRYDDAPNRPHENIQLNNTFGCASKSDKY